MSEFAALLLGVVFGILLGLVIAGKADLDYEAMKGNMDKAKSLCETVGSNVYTLSINNDVVCRDGSEFAFK